MSSTRPLLLALNLGLPVTRKRDPARRIQSDVVLDLGLRSSDPRSILGLVDPYVSRFGLPGTIKKDLGIWSHS